MEPMTPPTPPAARSVAARCLAAMLLAVVALVIPYVGRAAAQPVAPPTAGLPAVPAPEIDAAAGVLVDASSGAVIWEHNGHQARSVASTTKILTALVAEDTYEPDELLPVSAAAQGVEGSRLGVEAGTKLGRDDLLAALLLVSGNDVAEVFAENHPGGREGFLAAMQGTCELLGCTDSTWRDPSGLDAPGHQASAADLAIVSRALLARPLLAEIVASPTLPITWPDGRTQVLDNHNKMVRYETDPGTIGVKTGFTSKAGHTLVSAQRRGERTLIAVVLDAEDHYEQVRTLFDYGFSAPVPEDAEVLGLTPEDIEREAAAASADQQPQAAAETADPGSYSGSSFPVVAAVAAVVLVTLGAVTIMVGRRSRNLRV